jgi:hypothetical protein
MDYQKHYDLLINRALSENRKKLKKPDPNYVYYEAHHILPKCIYPEFANFKLNPWNKALLTPEEHYVAHQLMIKIYNYHPKLISAAHKMTSISPTNTGRSVLKLYKWLRELQALEQSRRETGKKRSRESIEKRTETRRKNGWNKNPEETKRKQSEARIGIVFSEEHIENLKISHMGIVYGPCSKEKAEKISKSQKGRPKPPNRHKSYEEQYGKNRAAEIKQKQSTSAKNRTKKNPLS